MKIDEDVRSRIDQIIESPSTRFDLLVGSAGLRPREDFVGVDLTEVDFSEADLGEFDFTGSDLRRANWTDTSVFPLSVQDALLGIGRAPIRPGDLRNILQSGFGYKNWSYRFFLMKVVIDNFGVTKDVLSSISVLIRDDEEYFPVNCYLYFLGQLLNNEQFTRYAVEMARNGNSYTNMYRIKKSRRLISDAVKYHGSVFSNQEHRLPWQPTSGELESSLSSYL